MSEQEPASFRPFTDFLAAMQFLTLMPPVIRRGFTPEEMGRAVGYYPLVGLALGLILAGADQLFGRFFPGLVGAALLLAAWTLLSGGLHVDGFLDACDGLLGGSTPEQRMEIMRDHRIGAFAFAGGALLLLIKFTALATLGSRRLPALILAPVLGRWSMSFTLFAFPYARAQGLGKHMKDYVTWWQVALATLIALSAAWFLAGWRGLAIAGIAALVMLVAVRFTLKRIPGLTGDTYGMINELTEMAVLLAFFIF